MRIGEDAIAALVAAKHDAGQDLFLLPDLPLSPADVTALSRALNKNLLVFLPGPFYPAGLPEDACFFYEQGRGGRRFDFPAAPFVCWADIRLAGNEAFQDAMLRADIFEWILPFADCADPAEHGYRQSYAQLAELRAQSRRFTGITALFNDAPEEARYQRLFGGAPYITVGLPGTPKLRAVPAGNDAERQRLLLRSCLLRHEKPAVVFFPTRRQAEEFVRFAAPHCPSAVVHGGRTRKENAEALDRFRAGALTLLAATKHLLPSAPFIAAGQVFYAGLPFSPALIGRCAALLPPGETPVCVTTHGDLSLNARLSETCAAALALPKTPFSERRKEKQARAIRLLKD